MSGTGISEYYDEYCVGSKKVPGAVKPTPIVPCRKPEDVEPVGGRAQARAAAATKVGLPVVDGDFVATQYNAADRGTHRVQPQWRDPRWSDGTRISSSTLYEPADRDPANRNNFYVYKSTQINPLDTPCRPMAVPDVHKLRYMHGTYVTYDDWY